MARQSKPVPARKAQPRNDSPLLRSAESLGRMIGMLQRELDIASRQLEEGVDAARKYVESRVGKDRLNAHGPARGAARKRRTTSKKQSARAAPARTGGARRSKKMTLRNSSKSSRPR